MNRCRAYLADGLGLVIRWLTGPNAARAITCDLEPGHRGDHMTECGTYRWSR